MAEPSPSEIAYEEAHIDQSRQINIAVSNGICLGIAFVAVLLRFISRRLAGTNNGADDWWAWIALVGKLQIRKRTNGKMMADSADRLCSPCTSLPTVSTRIMGLGGTQFSLPTSRVSS